MKNIRPFFRTLTLPKDEDFKTWVQPNDYVALEIGCGAGLHPILWTKQNPHKKLIAIERTKNKFESFEQRIKNNPRDNLFSVNCDASDWIPANLIPESIDELFLLYPNPYPKEKQANKRWYRSSFFHCLKECLKPGAKIHLATNEKFFYEEAKKYGVEYWSLKILQDQKLNPSEHSPRTHFEKKYLLRGETCYDVIFYKKDS